MMSPAEWDEARPGCGRFLLVSLQSSFFPGLWVKGEGKSDLLGFITNSGGRGF